KRVVRLRIRKRQSRPGALDALVHLLGPVPVLPVGAVSEVHVLLGHGAPVHRAPRARGGAAAAARAAGTAAAPPGASSAGAGLLRPGAALASAARSTGATAPRGGPAPSRARPAPAAAAGLR